MQTEENKITIQSYLDFSQLLSQYRGTHEENRLFFLKHEKKSSSSLSLLLDWANAHLFRISDTLVSSRFSKHFSNVNSLVGFFSLLIGFFVGIGLLSYSGKEPVNIIYYLFFVMFLPLMSMIITLFSMISQKNIFNFFTLFFPLHWFEKIVGWFSFKDKMDFIEENFSFKLQKWMFIQRLQLFSLLFSLGLFFALLFIVISQDVAFAWSTTLQISATAFHGFLEVIALPWISFFPSFMPSLELVEMSQHYRLGEKLNTTMVNNAYELGAWWKYLAMTTLFYAVILRFLLWLFSGYGLKKVLIKEFFALDGVQKLLREFEIPFVTTKAIKVEKHLKIEEEKKSQIKKFVPSFEIKEKVESIEDNFNNIIGWNFSSDEILLINDSKKIKAISSDSVGGSHSFAEDESVAKKSENRVLLYVKSWEPPTMDFIDFLEELIDNKKVYEIQVFPLGTSEKMYVSSPKELTIWNRKIEGLKSQKVWVIDAE